MRMKMEEFGCDELIVTLTNIARKVPETGRKTMHRGADKIIKEAQLNAPVDKHNLEQSITKEIGYDQDQGGRLTIIIRVGGSVNGVDVEEYAMSVHENYGDMTPGPGTIAKREANPGRYVGEKFLQRAVEDQRQKLMKAMIDAIYEELEF